MKMDLREGAAEAEGLRKAKELGVQSKSTGVMVRMGRRSER